MIIRRANSQDVRACARIMAGTPLWQRYGVTEESAARRIEQGIASQAEIAVAESEQGVCGFIWYSVSGAFERSGYIRLVGVQPGSHSQGIGKALMAYAEEHVFKAASDIFLLVSDFNTPARDFYKRQGYVQVGEIPGYILPEVSELILHKRRPAQAGQQAYHDPAGSQ